MNASNADVGHVSDEDAKSKAKLKETRAEMLSRHQKEIKELQGKEIALKKAAAKGSKAEQKAKKKAAEDEIVKLDAVMKARQAKELASMGFQGDEKEQVASIDTLVKAIAGVTTSGAPDHPGRPSKGQKFREKRAQQEAQRQQRIQEEQSNLVNEREVEDQQLTNKLNPIGLGLKEIKPDGHCLYRAVEDQLALHPNACPLLSYQQLRELAASFMRSHPEDFLPFIGGDLEREIEGNDPQSKFETYCREVEATASWGGQLELGALAQALKKHIVVYSANGPDVEMGTEYTNADLKLRISYHRHAFGLGEHYNSVVPLLPR
ncbi:OVARIAN TUMOR DOMAIN-containing deubiquitinating enzyme 5 [Physcomitrium patens]|uniref:OTU domain-containing protein n=1 Tax=Physcomitrium patens TaxID=3218 RepID=A9SIR2_PHYPA|nr:OTU domain-containing protein 6B-like [Physcomitrium patens]PNR38998.1 hypothetical protein PHYPA_019276 [Physcomitrium patens]|eukprot:XP_024397303.1 OTU domain-containing protein 6B-like [Physcomitrella patens]